MIANIFENGKQIDRIIADEDFAKLYCEQNGYTYELEPYQGPDRTPTSEPTNMERFRADLDYLFAMAGVEL